jgi:hypothetical protein
MNTTQARRIKHKLLSRHVLHAHDHQKGNVPLGGCASAYLDMISFATGSASKAGACGGFAFPISQEPASSALELAELWFGRGGFPNMSAVFMVSDESRFVMFWRPRTGMSSDSSLDWKNFSTTCTFSSASCLILHWFNIAQHAMTTQSVWCPEVSVVLGAFLLCALCACFLCL